MFKTNTMRSLFYIIFVMLFLSACATTSEVNTPRPAYASFLDQGIYYYGQNQYERARDSFSVYSRAAQYDNDKEATTTGIINRAVASRGLGQSHFAHYLMQTAFRFDPELEPLNENSATGLVDIGEFEAAENKLSNIIDSGGASTHAYHSRGLVRLQTKNYHGALDDFNKEKELNPQADTRCYNKAKSLSDGEGDIALSNEERQQIENVFTQYKEAMFTFDGAAVTETVNKIWIDSYFSNLKRKALFADASEMDGLEVFDMMMVYYLRNHYDAQALVDELPLDLFAEVINQGWIKSQLKNIVDDKVVYDVEIVGYQPIIDYQTCNDFYSVYITFDGSLGGWKQNFSKEKNAWRVSSNHLIDIFRVAVAEYSWQAYEGGSALWGAYEMVENKLLEQNITLSPSVVDPLLPKEK